MSNIKLWCWNKEQIFNIYDSMKTFLIHKLLKKHTSKNKWQVIYQVWFFITLNVTEHHIKYMSNVRDPELPFIVYLSMRL